MVQNGHDMTTVKLSLTRKSPPTITVYYLDGNKKGFAIQILVNVGDRRRHGQPIHQYSSTEAQTAYDANVRAVNKADRQLKIY